MRIIILILIALFITSISFADDRLNSNSSQSGKIEVMEQLGLVEPAKTGSKVHNPKRVQRPQTPVPERIKIRHLADTMTLGD